MKKFNKMESNLICDSLNYYVANLEAEIKQMEEDPLDEILKENPYFFS